MSGSAKSAGGDLTSGAKSAVGDAKGAAQGAGRQIDQATPDLSGVFDDIVGKVPFYVQRHYSSNNARAIREWGILWNTQKKDSTYLKVTKSAQIRRGTVLRRHLFPSCRLPSHRPASVEVVIKGVVIRGHGSMVFWCQFLSLR